MGRLRGRGIGVKSGLLVFGRGVDVLWILYVRSAFIWVFASDSLRGDSKNA